MNILELLQEHQKSCIVVKQWLLDKMLASMKVDSVPDDFKEVVRKQGIDNEKVATIVEGLPRSLFDVFDDHKIYIQISVDIKGTSPVFRYGFGDDVESNDYTTRKEAEKDAIIHAFKLLEAKL